MPESEAALARLLENAQFGQGMEAFLYALQEVGARKATTVSALERVTRGADPSFTKQSWGLIEGAGKATDAEPAVIDDLVKKLGGETPDRYPTLVQNIGAPAVPALIKASNDASNPRLRRQSLDALVRIARAPKNPVSNEFFDNLATVAEKETDAELRRDVIANLPSFARDEKDSARIFAVVEKAADSKDERVLDVATEVAATYGAKGDPILYKVLQPTLKKELAITVLNRLTEKRRLTPETLDKLIEVTAFGNLDVAVHAAYLLSKRGRAAKKSIAALELLDKRVDRRDPRIEDYIEAIQGFR